VDVLVEQHADHVYRFALRLSGDHHVAEDLTQETFLRAWRHRRQLDAVKSARLWLLAVTGNLWRDRLRRRRHPAARAEPLADVSSDTAVGAEQCIQGQDEVDRVLAAMDRLPPRQREVLHLVACEQLSLAEVAGVLGMTTDAVKASLSVARKKMRQWMADLCQNVRA
jgi:RNA polymerase sigma-70 factor (ECF subfamily)